jgi:hypothetical protein
MIQLANDPNASRSFQRAAANDSDGKEPGADGRRGRAAHAWPFLSPHAARPARPDDSDKPAANDSGS